MPLLVRRDVDCRVAIPRLQIFGPQLRLVMSFKSQAQRRKFAELLVEGKISPGICQPEIGLTASQHKEVLSSYR